MAVVAILLIASVVMTLAISRTLGKVLVRRNRRLAVWCCGLVVPLLSGIAGIVHSVIENSRPMPTYIDTISLGGVLVVLGLLAVPFTVVASEFATPRLSYRRDL